MGLQQQFVLNFRYIIGFDYFRPQVCLEYIFSRFFRAYQISKG